MREVTLTITNEEIEHVRRLRKRMDKRITKNVYQPDEEAHGVRTVLWLIERGFDGD